MATGSWSRAPAPLREIPRVAQSTDGVRRRWFTGPSADLFVWEEDGRIVSFEFCYGKPGDEHALRWSAEGGAGHTRIDDGEATPLKNYAPIAVPDGHLDAAGIALEFERVSGGLEPRIFRAVLTALLRLAPGAGDGRGAD